jgi:hypothetical protein
MERRKKKAAKARDFGVPGGNGEFELTEELPPRQFQKFTVSAAKTSAS